MRKLFLAILVMIPLGIFAQGVRYVTVPTSLDEDSAPAASFQNQMTSRSSSSFNSTNEELVRGELKTSQTRATRTTFVKNMPDDNWFFSLYSGAGILESEESRYLGLSERLNLTGGFAIGKWWNPVWGLRMSFSTAKLTGFVWNAWHAEGDRYFMGGWFNGENYVSSNNNPDVINAIRSGIQNSYTDGTGGIGADLIYARYLNPEEVTTSKGYTGHTYNLTYAAASLDLMLNLKNFFTQYNPHAIFNPVVYGGVGYAYTFKAEAINQGEVQQLLTSSQTGAGWNTGRTAVSSIMGKAGLQLNFRMGEGLDFFIDGQAMIMPENFDRRVGGNVSLDAVYNAQVGFTYKFKERHFYEPATIINTQSINNVREESSDDVASSLKRIEAILDRAPQAPAPEASYELENLKVIINFVIDRWDVRQSEMYKLDEVARFMNKYPRVRVSVEGHADAQTAYPAYNKKLSESRANEVARILTSKYGINRSRLNVNHFGDTVQPFDVNELNRAVIIFDIPEY